MFRSSNPWAREHAAPTLKHLLPSVCQVEDAVVEDETAFAELVRSMLGSKTVRGSWPGWGSGKGLNSFRPRAASRIHPARTSRDLKRAKTLPLPARARNARSASDSTLFGTSSERSSVSEPG
jgi:hypothetical protein